MDKIVKVIAYVIGTVILFTLGIGIFLQRNLLSPLGLVTLGCIFILVIAATAFSLVVGADFTIRRVTRAQYRDIGDSGTLAQNLIGRITEYAPHSPIATANHRMISAEKKAPPAIPTIAEMLAKGMLNGVTLYLGYQIEKNELVPITGTFNDIRTFAILGKGGAGKTVRLFLILIQCVLAGATLYVCDPHLMKPGSITRLLLPLQRWIKFAVPTAYLDDAYRKQNPLTEEALNGFLMTGFADFRARMERRVLGEETDFSPCVLVCDEFTRMMYNPEYGATCVDTVVQCANQYRDYNGFSVVIMHEVVATNKQETKQLVARLRRSLHAIFVMRTDREYAKFCLEGKWLKQVERLRTGSTIFIDTNGEIREAVFTPHGSIADSYTLEKMMLEALPAAKEPLQIASPQEQIAWYPRSTPAYTARPGTRVTPEIMEPLQHKLLAAARPGETVKEPLDSGETFTDEDEGERAGETFTSEEKQLVLNTFYALCLETQGKVTRDMIRVKLGWTKKRYPTIKSVCDTFGIAKP